MLQPTRFVSTTASLLFAEETELARFATILDDATLITGPERAEILQLLGVSWIESLTVDGRRRRTSGATATTLESVGILPTSSIKLFGADARLWFTCATTCPTRPTSCSTPCPTTCASMSSERPRSSQPPRATRGRGSRAGAGRQRRGRTLAAAAQPRQRRDRAARNVEVSVRAEWETFGVIALSISSAACVMLGVVRTILRARARASDASTRWVRPSGVRERHRARERDHRGRHDRLAPDRARSLDRAGRRDRSVGSGAADAFAIANQLPNNIYAIISAGLLTAVIVPQIVKAASHADGGRAFISKLFTLGTVGAAGHGGARDGRRTLARAAVRAPTSRRSSRRSRPRSRTGACRRSSSTACTRSSARP